MKFRKEVQEQFEKAGWYEGRNLQKRYDKINKFNKLPSFLKEFLYEYGGLLVETNDLSNTFSGSLNLKRKLKINSYLLKPSLEGNVLTFPVGYYQNPHDPGSVECDKTGAIYLMGEYPVKLTNNFIEGIEKIILKDQSGFIEWNYQDKYWDEEY
ncbi:SUKH-3 domain-containing protein [uncultured Kordia sp.]|uniref:SUKH-3 domain-containing protein n=1 Tax=uncultured Kordia sp. TaxID=507699 RepID=UPI00261FDDC7|nr:SUKH-3 domain-containing protein [uncultured Kordia sp.]